MQDNGLGEHAKFLIRELTATLKLLDINKIDDECVGMLIDLTSQIWRITKGGQDEDELEERERDRWRNLP